MIDKNKVFIIAEAGVNHNGDFNLAKQLIDAAVTAGVDAVKFQTWKTELLVTKDAKQAEYQTENTKIEESQFDMLKKLELSYTNFELLKTYCDSKNILFLSTPDEQESANFLAGLQDIFKIGSGELTNAPYLSHVASLGKQIIISTGMGNMSEIEDAIRVLTKYGTPKENITILHANTQYPTPWEDVNLKAMQTIKQKFDVAVGYSDHTLGIEVPIAAVAMGAKVIEKHFTLDKTMDGPDHKASLDPVELKAMVDSIRNIELAMGNGIKEASKSEKPNIEIVRKSIVANSSIKKGEIFTSNNLTTKRPGNGLSPMEWFSIIGTEATKDYNTDDLI
jgi:N-acetylneuraminate synthase